MIQLEKNNLYAVLKVVLFLIVSAVTIWGYPMQVNAAGATICHQHTGNCYENRQIECTDPKEILVHNEDFYCNNCGRIASAKVMVEYYVCEYEDSRREFRRTAACYTCYNIVYTAQTGESDTHLRMGDVCICGLTEQTVVADLKLSVSTGQWTKENVSVKATIAEPVKGYAPSPYSYAVSGSGISGSNGNYTVTKNGTYTVSITAANKKTATASIIVNNIDKEKPIINRCYVNKSYPEYEEAQIIVEADDSLSGLADKPYSFDGGVTYGTQNYFTITKNGTYFINVKDKVGNYSTTEVKVTCFEKKPEPEVPKMDNTEEAEQGTSKPVKPEQDNQSSFGVQGGSILTGGNAGQSESTVSGSASEWHNNATEVTSKEKDKNSEYKTDKEQTSLWRENSTSLSLDGRLTLENIPGIQSSLYRYKAEENAVPMTLNVEQNKPIPAYSQGDNTEENLVKNISMETSKQGGDGEFAQVSQVVVASGVLLCIGMVAFLIIFLVKKR